jgi:hypothetical protein
MPRFVLRGTISFPFEAEIEAEHVDASFDLAAHFAVPPKMVGYWALEESGPLSDLDQLVTVHDTDSSYVIESVEAIDEEQVAT